MLNFNIKFHLLNNIFKNKCSNFLFSKSKMSKNNTSFIFSLILILQMFIYISSIKEWWEETKMPLLNEANFYDYVGKEKFVVVEFFTKWCIYCKMMNPEYEKFYELYLQKREDVLITKIECSINQKKCTDYGVFAFPFVGLFFPNNKKIKSVFKYRRELDDFDKWINLVAPKKNLKPIIQNKEIEDNSNGDNNITQIEDYISKQFSDIKKDIINIEKYINKTINNGKKEILLENENLEGENDNDIIEIKITPFLIVKCILFIFIVKIVWYYIKNTLFTHTSLPNNLHQKH